jgi:GDP-L-fucose synthase
VSINLEGKKVLVTGGESMIGGAVCKSLERQGARVDPCPHEECDLLNRVQFQERIWTVKPDYVVHAAGWNGGIEWNRMYPESIYYKTSLMALNVLKSCVDSSVEKVVSIISSCAYPNELKGAMEEKDLWSGLPNASVECHGLSKRMLDAYSRQVNRQHGLMAVCAVLTNSYGPNDSFHPDKTKVVGALIRKFVEAKERGDKEVVCWGTGAPLREFMYSDDAGAALVEVLKRYDDPTSVINVGSGQEVSIKELTETIADVVEYEGNVVWDTDKQDGQMRKLLDSTKFLSLNKEGWATLSLKYGIGETVEWYKQNKEYADNKRTSL